MASRPLRFAWALARELALGVAAWVGVCVTLALWYVAIPVDPVEAILGPGASPEQAERVRQQLGLGGSVVDQFVSTAIDLLTLQFGESYVIYPGTSVWELAWAPFWRTVVLALAALLVAGALAVVPLALTWYLRGTIASPVVTAPAYVLGSVPAFAWTILFVSFSAQGPLPFTPIWGGNADPLSSPVKLLLPTLALSIPLVSFAVRRVALAGDDGPFAVASTTARGVAADGGSSDDAWSYGLRSVTVESWTTMAYVVGALATVEMVFAYRGIAYIWFQALIQADFPVVLGTTALVALVMLALGVVRNVAYAAGEVVGSTPSTLAADRTAVTDGGRPSDDPDDEDGSDESGADAAGDGEEVPLGMPGSGEADRPDVDAEGTDDDVEAEDEAAMEDELETDDEAATEEGSEADDQPATKAEADPNEEVETGDDSPATAAESGSVSTGDPSPSSRDRPSFAGVLLSGRRFQVGLLAFGLLFLAGTIGSLALSARVGYVPQRGLDLAILVHALGSLTTSAVAAALVAIPVGVLTGTLAGRFGRPTGTVLGFPKDVLAGFPLFVLAALAVYFAGIGGGGRTTTELLIGGGAGLAILPGVFRATALEVDAVLSDRPGDRPGVGATVTDALPAALAPALGRSVNYVGFALLVAAELGFLGLGPLATSVPSDLQAYVTVEPGLFSLTLLPVVLPALALWLIGDGLRAAAVPE